MSEATEAFADPPEDDALIDAASDDEVVDAEVVDDASADAESADDPAGDAPARDAEADDDPAGDETLSDDPSVGTPMTDDTTAGDGQGPDPVDNPGSGDSVARERDEYLDALRRLQADFENFRKQALRRQGDAIEHATGRLVEELLAVLDACDAGIEHGDEGVTAIFTSLLGVLEKAGLERLDPVGEPFDPNAHEAVMHEPAGEDDDDAEGPVVAEVMRPGYRWKDRTLRAAMVKVRG